MKTRQNKVQIFGPSTQQHTNGQTDVKQQRCVKLSWMSLALKVKLNPVVHQLWPLTDVQRQTTSTRTVAYLRTLQRQLSGVEMTEKALRPAVDPKTGNVSFPDTEAYGEFLDSESW